MVPPKLQRREFAVPTLLLYVTLLSHLDYYSAADIAVADPLEPTENPQSEGGEHWKCHFLMNSWYLSRFICIHCISNTIP